MLLIEGMVLGNHISCEGIKVDPSKTEVIAKILVPQSQKEVRSFLGHASYYIRFIQK